MVTPARLHRLEEPGVAAVDVGAVAGGAVLVEPRGAVDDVHGDRPLEVDAALLLGGEPAVVGRGRIGDLAGEQDLGELARLLTRMQPLEKARTSRAKSSRCGVSCM